MTEKFIFQVACGWYDIYLDIVHKVRIIKVQQESKMLQRMIQDLYNSRPLTGLLYMPLSFWNAFIEYLIYTMMKGLSQSQYYRISCIRVRSLFR
jgi:hypothetical protein